MSSAHTFAQFIDDFEDGEISNWDESTLNRWAASAISPINGSFSLYHIYNNTVGDHDQVSLALPIMDITSQTTLWKFRLKYNYNPSGGNNWAIFLMSDAGAGQMHPSGAANGYILGVNYVSSDDTLRLWRVTAGTPPVVVISTNINWDNDLQPSDMTALEVVRSNSGEWEVKLNISGGFSNMQPVGFGVDNTLTTASYFGIYYLYTASADRNLWMDDIYIGEEIKDTIAPQIDSLYLVNSKVIKIEFNEKLDSATALSPLNYIIDGGIDSPGSIHLDATKESLLLYLDQKLKGQQQYSITVKNVEDKEGNAIKDTALNFEFEYIKAISIEVISGNELLLGFSQKLDTLSAEDNLNYNLDNGAGNPVSANVLLNDSTKVQLQFEANFSNKTHYRLNLQNIANQQKDSLERGILSFFYYMPQKYDLVVNEIMADPYPEVNLPNYEYIEIKNTTGLNIDLTGWKLKAGSVQRNFPAGLIDSAGYLTLCSNEASEYLKSYGKSLGFSSFPAITNSGAAISIYDSKNNLIDSVKFTAGWYADENKDDGGWSLERIDPLNTCSGITNWKASENINGGSPGTMNSVFAPNIDTEGPQIETIKVISENQIKVYFNEPLYGQSIYQNLNYSVNLGLGNPSSIMLSDDLKEVGLTFNGIFPQAQKLELTVNNVEDWCGNAMVSAKCSFTYYKVQAFDIIINEIFADPDPVVGLPEFEYIEIKNTTQFAIDLSGWKLKSGTVEKSFPSYILDSASYVILCSNNAMEYLKAFGETLGFSSFPSITNSGAVIRIYDENNNKIDSINFDLSWYSNIEKENGGWSLERIDPLNNCSGITNWKASENIHGGTPGAINSVYAPNIDTIPPILKKIEIVSENQLKLSFNETLGQPSAGEILNYTIDNGIGNPATIIDGNNLNEINLLFSVPFADGVNYKLNIKNLADNCGNSTAISDFDFAYYIAKPNDIVLNEIMADPEPTVGLPAYEYIEIYNTTEYNINLSGWGIAMGSTVKIIPSATINAGEYLVLCDKDVETVLQSFGNALGITSFPSISNSGQTITVYNKNGETISSVTYTNTWYKDEYKAEGGWALEQIDPLNPCGGENNWIASKDSKGGSPGQINSVYASNPDASAPELHRISVLNDKKICLYFNESIKNITVDIKSNIVVMPGLGDILATNIIEPDNKSMTIEFEEAIKKNTNYELEITGGIFDCAGNELYNNFARFAFPDSILSNDIVINEILFNPMAGGYDFVELYNRSGKTLDLSKLLIASYKDEDLEYSEIESISNEGYLFFPEEYIVLTENPEIVKQQYMVSNPEGFIGLANLPAYNNDKGRVILLDKWQNQIDNKGYNEDMQFALLATNKGVSLERINFDRPADDNTNWHSASELVGFATPAYENSQFLNTLDSKDEVKIEPEVFSPDNDGFEDVANIVFSFNEPGYVANIKIFDSRGRLIKYLANNQLLGVDGTISWDGLDENNKKAVVGIYVVYIELFDLNGKVKQFKKSVVVAAKY